MSYAAPLPRAAQARVALPFAVCVLIWGSTWFVIVSQLRYVPADWSIAYRFALGCAAMVVVARRARAPLALDVRGQRLAAVVGLTQFTLNYAFVYAAEARIASGLVALVSALLIVPNALFGWRFLGQPVSRRFLAGSAIAMAGVALLFADELHRGRLQARPVVEGVAVALAGVLAASTANVLQGSRAARAVAPPVQSFAMGRRR